MTTMAIAKGMKSKRQVGLLTTLITTGIELDTRRHKGDERNEVRISAKKPIV